MLMEQLMSRLSSDWRRKMTGSPVWEHVADNGLNQGEGLEGDAGAIIAAAYERLPGYAAEVLDVMLLLCGPAPIEEEKLVAELRSQARLSGAQIRMALARLGEAGIAFAIRKAWGERWWVLPSDLYATLMNHIYLCAYDEEQRRPSSGVLPLMDENGQFRTSPVPFERSVLYGLALIARNDAGLTSKGLLSKKMIDRLHLLFQSIEAPLAPFGLQTAHAGHYPLGVAMFLEAAHALDLVEMREGRLTLRRARLQRWLHDPQRDRQLQNWLASRLAEVAGADSAACAAILGLREESLGESWTAESILLLAEEKRLGLCNAGRKAADWSMHSRWPGIWLDVFHSFGWLELGHPADSADSARRLFRWKATPPEQSAELIIQPSGELLAGPGCGYACRWELELIAERRMDGELTHYALTAHTIASAFELGRTQTSIVRFLVAAAAIDSLPPSLETMLEQWTSGACQFEFVQATLLRCGSPERADWLAGQSQALPYILERVGPAVFVVDAEHVSPLRKLLQGAGLPPRKGIAAAWVRDKELSEPAYPEFSLQAPQNAVPEEEEAGKLPDSFAPESAAIALPGTEGLFVYDSAALRLCPLADDPVPERLHAADWESVPQMWSRQLREYHLSTRKELLQTAIALETSVRMKTGGELRTFIPERLEQRGSDWAVSGLWGEREGGEPVRLTPDMWGEMGLAMPDGLPT